MCNYCGYCKEEKEYFACIKCMYEKTNEYIRAHWEDCLCSINICKICRNEREEIIPYDKNRCKCTPYNISEWCKSENKT